MTFGTHIRLAVKRSAFGAAGGGLLLVGAGFLTAAAWMALKIAAGPVAASMIVGMAYVGVGAVVLALGQRRTRRIGNLPARHPIPAPRRPAAIQDVVAAFAQGVGAGIAARGRPRY